MRTTAFGRRRFRCAVFLSFFTPQAAYSVHFELTSTLLPAVLMGMKFEHFALNVSDPVTAAQWYVTHCGMTVARAQTEAPFTHFLADSSGRLAMEIYHNPKAVVHDFAHQHPLEFHFAFAVPEAEPVKARLVAAGATVFEEIGPENGTHLIMLRDPFGVALQICQRAQPFA